MASLKFIHDDVASIGRRQKGKEVRQAKREHGRVQSREASHCSPHKPFLKPLQHPIESQRFENKNTMTYDVKTPDNQADVHHHVRQHHDLDSYCAAEKDSFDTVIDSAELHQTELQKNSAIEDAFKRMLGYEDSSAINPLMNICPAISAVSDPFEQRYSRISVMANAFPAEQQLPLSMSRNVLPQNGRVICASPQSERSSSGSPSGDHNEHDPNIGQYFLDNQDTHGTDFPPSSFRQHESVPHNQPHSKHRTPDHTSAPKDLLSPLHASHNEVLSVQSSAVHFVDGSSPDKQAKGLFCNASTLIDVRPATYHTLDQTFSALNCAACGFDVEHLLQLIERTLWWSSQNSLSLERFIHDGPVLSDIARTQSTLKLHLEALHSYAMSCVLRKNRLANDPKKTLYASTENIPGNQPATSRGSSLDNDASELDLSVGFDGATLPVTDLAKTIASDSDQQDTGNHSRRGRPRKWKALENNRLKAYLVEHKNLNWIAQKMDRSVGDVKSQCGKLSLDRSGNGDAAVTGRRRRPRS